jgi:hypothetical protein
VSKQELFEAVWPAIAVSDDSLVQCIRELRDKIGDYDHRLIRTVHRRGYLLDAQVTGPEHEAVDRSGPTASPRSPSFNELRRRRGWSSRKQWYQALAAVSFSAAMLGFAYAYLRASVNPTRVDVVNRGPASPRLHIANELFTAEDAKRVNELAVRKQLPLPVYQIENTGGDVSGADRRFVGIWMSEIGWLGSFRQMMLIVTSVDAKGMADGYAANGPAQPKSHSQGPPRYWPLRMQISGDTVFFSDTTGQFEGTLTPQNKIALKVTFSDRVKTGWVLLEPIWTLEQAERSQSIETVIR